MLQLVEKNLVVKQENFISLRLCVSALNSFHDDDLQGEFKPRSPIRSQLCYASHMNHEVQDSISLELAQRIASGLPQHPEWIEFARANLERWSRLNSNAPSLLRCYDEWEKLLRRNVSQICAALIAETDEGQRLRQNSPFVGILSPEEVWEIKSRHRHATATA